MKRTCNGCIASNWDKGSYICELGYDLNLADGKPKEQCPKPLTNMEMIDAEHRHIITK